MTAQSETEVLRRPLERERMRRTGSAVRYSPTAAPSAATSRARLPWYVHAFLISLVIPGIFMLGPVRLSPYRVMLIGILFIGVLRLLSGRCGRLQATDVLIFGYCLWVIFATSLVHGFSASIQSSAITCIETAGAYLAGRCFVEGPESFRALFRTLLLIVATLLPFGLIEAVTGQNTVLLIAGLFMPTYAGDVYEMRMGLFRVQGPFEHPILFGVFATCVFAPAFLVVTRERPLPTRFMATGIVGLAVILSLSSGPFGAMLVQAALLTWNAVLSSVRSRWWVLVGLLAAVYLFLEIAANRPPIEVAISLISFDGTSYWIRKLIWDYAYQSVWNNPILGTGFGDWDRPSNIYFSIDNAWLIQAVRFGSVGFALFSGAFATRIVSVARSRKTDPISSDYKIAYLIVLSSLILSTVTVAPWDAAGLLLPLLLGCGAWLETSEAELENSRRRAGHNRPAVDRRRPDRNDATRERGPARAATARRARERAPS